MNCTPSLDAERPQHLLFLINMSKRIFLQREFEKKQFFFSFFLFALFFEFQRKVQNDFFSLFFQTKSIRKNGKSWIFEAKKQFFFQKKIWRLFSFFGKIKRKNSKFSLLKVL
jgi:hypothetical protein